MLPTTTMLPTATTGAAPTPTEIPISISIRETYYQIEGTTAEELREQINQLGPVDSDGDRWDAISRWHVSWSYLYSRGGAGCILDRVKITLDISLVFPQWHYPKDTSPELIDQWNTYLVAMQNHEDGHKKIDLEIGQAVYQGLNSLSWYKTCTLLERAADARIKEILDQYRQQNADYDELTDHGATQGATFP